MSLDSADYGVQDSLSLDTGGMASTKPGKWTRFRAFMGKERLFIGPVGLNGWYPFKVLAVAAFFLLAAWWRAGW